MVAGTFWTFSPSLPELLPEELDVGKPVLALEVALMILIGEVQVGLVTSSISLVIFDGVAFLEMISEASRDA